MEPKCPICKGKVKDNTYLWDGKKLYHKICFKTSGMKLKEPKVMKVEESPEGKSVTVGVDTIRLSSKTN